MKLHHFEIVVAVAELGSLRAACRHLAIAQPAMTRSLGELEHELGAPLFQRHSRGMVLTLAGDAFVKRATTVVSEVKRIRDEVEQLGGGLGGSVVAGLSIAAHIALLPKALARFRRRYPLVKLHIIEGLYPTLEEGIRRGSVDFYIGPRPDGNIAADFLQERLFENTRTILCRKGHPFEKAKFLKDLRDAEWATTSITLRAEDEFSELFQKHGLPPPKIVLRSQSALTLMISILNSDLLAMVPIQWTKFAPTAHMLSTIDVSERLPAPDIVSIRRAGAPLTPAASALAEMLRDAT